MKYSMKNPVIPYLIDLYRTGNYGEDFYGEDDRGVRCCECGRVIPRGERYFDVNREFFCMDCEETAEQHILDIVKENYIFVD